MNAQRYNTPQSYLEFVDRQHASVVQQTWNYMYTYTQESDYKKRNGERKKLENTLNRSLRNIVKEQEFDKTFQKSVIKYLEGNIAIVKNDYGTLLTYKESSPQVNKLDIQKKIRNAMLQLRQNYDNAVKAYAIKHNLEIKKNTSNLALQMQHTIKVYDYYNKLNIQIQALKNSEVYVWENLLELTSEQFESRLQNLKSIKWENLSMVREISKPSDRNTLYDAFLKFHDFFGETFESQTTDIKIILEAYRTNDRTDIIKKTDAFNKTKTWYNINRRDDYDLWFTKSQQYLREEIKPL